LDAFSEIGILIAIKGNIFLSFSATQRLKFFRSPGECLTQNYFIMLPGERPIRLKAAAALVSLSPRTFYAMMYTGELKDVAHRQGPRLLYFYPSELLAYMANRKYIPVHQEVERRKALAM
jgi:predicted DNA-binding transcriptional regulator AlpA